MFGVVALLMGWLGVNQVAAHQVVLNLASLTFMVPLGVASAAAVIVGHAVGRGDAGGVRRSTVAALVGGRGLHGAHGRAVDRRAGVSCRERTRTIPQCSRSRCC